MTGDVGAQLNELNQLLDRPNDAPTDLAERLRSPNQPKLLFFGAGGLGRYALAALRGASIRPDAFLDETLSKQGDVIEGIPVLSIADGVTRFGPSIIVVVTIHNPHASYLGIRGKLEDSGFIAENIYSFHALATAFGARFLPYLYLDHQSKLLEEADNIRSAFHLFQDEESANQYVSHIRFRLTLEFSALPNIDHRNYFPEEIVDNLPEPVAFVDCGAFDGDTIRAFIKQCPGWRTILAFEPDPQNFTALQNFVATLGLEERSRVQLVPAGVGERRGKMMFQSGEGTASTFSQGAGNLEVEIVPLKDWLSDLEGTPFVKIDVEGYEVAALRGGWEELRAKNAVLAVSVYHRPQDLWRLPQLIHELDPTARLYLRSLGEDGMDIVCIAVPDRRVD